MPVVNDPAYAEKQKGVVFIEFYTDDCGPCKLMAPKMKKLEEEFTDVWFCYAHVQLHSASAAKYGVRGFPTFVLRKDGRILEIFSGSQSIARMREKLTAAVA